jgi:hypothetical protein
MGKGESKRESDRDIPRVWSQSVISQEFSVVRELTSNSWPHRCSLQFCAQSLV